jgi:predicted metalloprotease with PDZ domain
MMARMMRCALGMALLALVCSPRAWGQEAVRYTLQLERPNTHLMDITVHVTGLKGPAAEFAMPDWAPGSYYIQNYAVNVQGFRAIGPNGNDLAWRKTDSQTWRVELAGANAVTIEYKLFGNTLRNNQAQYNERHAFFGGPAVWMYLVGGKDRPIDLLLLPPQGWKVATGMERTGENKFHAANYDWFADCPMEISDFAEKDFQVLGTTYHVVVHDILGQKDFSKFVADVQKFVETSVQMFQPVAGSGEQAAPFKDYWFLFHIWPDTGGGLEHLNSTQINYSADWDDTSPAGRLFGNRYQLKVYVASHEFFHAWNVKRLRPKPLGPFDYSEMVHTPSLWISEGLTDYYGWLAMVRAGLITPQEYLDGVGKVMTAFEAEPGRKERSIEDTSWDTWFPNGNVVPQKTNLANTWYSYYDGGQMVGHILDFAIRQSTNNQKTLDDWMRLMYSRYALPKPGFEPQDAIRAASEVAGKDISDLFRKFISGKEPIPYEQYFAYAGVTVEKQFETDKAWMGAAFEKGEDGRAKVRNILPGSPAEAGGLDREDVILAVNNRATADTDAVSRMVEEHKPGETVRLTVLRLGQLKEIPVTLGTNPNPTYKLKPAENQTEEQKAIYNSWLGIK